MRSSSGLPVEDLDLLAPGHDLRHVVEGHVAAGPGIVELPVAVPADHPDGRQVAGHAATDNASRQKKQWADAERYGWPGASRCSETRSSSRERVPAPGPDESGPEEEPQAEGHHEEDAGQVERPQHDPDQVEGGLLDLDPGDGRPDRHRPHRAPRTFATVGLRAPSVNCLIWVRFRASR